MACVRGDAWAVYGCGTRGAVVKEQGLVVQREDGADGMG